MQTTEIGSMKKSSGWGDGSDTHPRPVGFRGRCLGFLWMLLLPAFLTGQTRLDFTDQNWTVALGLEFPGAAGNAWVETKGPSNTLVLHGDFRKGGAYVGWTKRFPGESDMKTLRFTVRSFGATFIVFRATDSTGQTFQQKLNLAAGKGWQDLTITDFPGAKNHGNSWGGKKDGRWYGPLTAISILIDKGCIEPGGEPMAKLAFANMEWE